VRVCRFTRLHSWERGAGTNLIAEQVPAVWEKEGVEESGEEGRASTESVSIGSRRAGGELAVLGSGDGPETEVWYEFQHPTMENDLLVSVA